MIEYGSLICGIDNKMKNVWEHAWKTNPSGFRNYPNEEFIRFMGRNFLGISSERGDIKILEIGCGNGANLWMVAKEGFQAYGVDSSHTSLKLCKETFKKWEVRGNLYLGDLRSLPFKDEYFDAVFEVRAIEYVTYTDHKRCYSEIRRVLKDRGKFYSFHFGKGSWDFTYGGGKLIDKDTVDNTPNEGAIFPNCGINCFLDEKDLRELLKGVGFKDIKIEKVIKTYENITKTAEYLSVECIK